MQRMMKALMVTIAIYACGDATGTNSGDALTADEIAAVLNVLSESFVEIDAAPGFALHGQPTRTDLASFRTVPVNADLRQTVGCPNGGSITLDGSIDGDVDDETLEGSIEVEFRWDFNACVVVTSTNTLTVDGDPYIEFDGDFEFTENSFSISGTEKGGFSFTTSDNRSGSCAIDVAFDTSINTANNAVSVSFTGTVCGLNATQFGG